ncbi:MAG: 1-deoxy-D-xylulose-5-phosphate reductoisomerase [Gemmatimonadetes bacterium]|nr:1-deoxy-D-xylulose-5-phosphate reductoisomerase [Gemmatimonadota bacterium]
MTRGMAPRGVTILGSTGSIGTAALRVISRHRDAFCVSGLTAHSNAALLAEQVAEWRPEYTGLVSGGQGIPSEWQSGEDVLVQAATASAAAVVLNAKHHGGELVPVDSEHTAILQCIAGHGASAVRRLIITASGGPFRTWPNARIADATLADALKHPTWSMGRKITVDSASLVNKALEVIEAHFLFGVPYDRIEVVVHPQSIVHSMVEFIDGSVVAQLGVPSMELPILYALSYPDRLEDDGVARFDPVAAASLTFEAVRTDAFPSFKMGLEAGRTGGVAPAVFNAANEAAVQRFLDGSLTFGGIPRAIDSALSALGDRPLDGIASLRDADASARSLVQGLH